MGYKAKKHKKNSGAAETHKWLLKQGISEEQIAESNRQLKAYRERLKNPNLPRWPPTFPLPDKYDDNDPELIGEAKDATDGLYRHYINYSGSGYLGEQYKYAIRVAYDVRSAWAIDGLVLPEVPLAKNFDWPTKQDFLRLNLWFRNALVSVQEKIERQFAKEKAAWRQPLSKKAGLIYEKLKSLPEHKGMTLPEIQEWIEKEHNLNLDDGTWKTIHKELIPYSIKNKKRIGYYFR